jgi:predicted ribosomally synthesized peptide with nif11-like leader
MSATAASAAIERMETDEEFAVRVRDAGGPAAIIETLGAEGFEVTPEEMRDALLDRYGDELTQEQLDALTGGADWGTGETIAVVSIAAVYIAGAASAAV